MRKLPDFNYEERLWRRGFTVVAGADEVGRGAFAGPVVAAAVAFAPFSIFHLPFFIGGKTFRITDSKKMRVKERERAAEWIKKNALAWGIGEVPVAYINRCGIARATRTAFRRAIAACNQRLSNPVTQLLSNSKIDFLLIDAFYVPYTRGIKRRNQLAIVKGDEKSISIAAASIIAKVYRDKLMQKLARKHRRYGWARNKQSLFRAKGRDIYGWARNKGYGTRQHREAILQHGLTRLHRKAFVRKLLSNVNNTTLMSLR